MDIRSRGNENILDYSLQQLHAAEINNSTSNIDKLNIACLQIFEKLIKLEKNI